MSASVSMTGSGTIGHLRPGWSVLESCTPAMPGDSRGSVGSAKFKAAATSTSRFVTDNTLEMTSDGGVFRGRVSDVELAGDEVSVSVAGPLQFLNVDKTMPPIWLDQTVDLTLATYGGDTGQIGRSQGVAVDPVDGGFLITSQDEVDGNDRYKVIKYDADGNYVTEFGSLGTGNGQIGQFGATIAVSPVDQSVWIGDLFNLRIMKFTTADGGSTYSYAAKVGSSGSGNGQFGSSNTYIAVACDSSGNVYASDRGNARIQKFNSSAVYQSQVAVGTDPTQSVYAIAVDSSDQVLAGIRFNSGVAGAVNIYSSSLVLQETVYPGPPSTLLTSGVSGVQTISADPNGGTWITWFGASFVVHYDDDWKETFRWYGETVTHAAAGADAVIAYLLSYRDISLRRVVAFKFEPVPLSTAIERYMTECDPTLNGYTLDYQAAVDPDVVFPGWSGNVWAKLKELCAVQAVELVRDDDAQTFIVRDLGSATATITNHGPISTVPQNLTPGRIVDVIYQNPRAGGGVVWDAEAENETISVEAGKTITRILYTDNHPADLVAVAPTDTLPVQPGLYYVVDSDGASVSVEQWQSAGGRVSATVGESPGTVVLTITGPTSEISGFTGPYYFATGRDPEDTPALSIVGNGTFCTPALFRRTESQGSPFASPFMDTVDRVLSRGHYPSLSDPTVEIRFTCAVSDLPAMGQAGGAIITHEQSKYRITEVDRGDLVADVTAERFVTAADWTSTWSGEAASVYESYWSGYSAGDEQVQPLRHA